MVAIWPFWNGLPEIKIFGHLIIFWPFLKIKENSIYLKPTFEKSVQNLQYFMKFLLWNLFFLTNFWRKFGLFSFMKIWPFLKLLIAKFSLFKFFWTWQPWAEEEKGQLVMSLIVEQTMALLINIGLLNHSPKWTVKCATHIIGYC